MVEIKLCPFCGSKTNLIKHEYYGNKSYHCQCSKCLTEVEGGIWKETKEHAIKLWNTRSI